MTQAVESRTDSELLDAIDSRLASLFEDRFRYRSDRDALGLVLQSLRVSARLAAWQR